MRKLLFALSSFLWLAAAHAQTGQFPAYTFWGNATGSRALPTTINLSQLIDGFLTCSAQGSIIYRGASGWVCLGPSTANKPLLTGGASANVAWGPYTLPASGTSGGIPYFSSTSTMASSAALGANQIVFGGGAGATPATGLGLGTTTTVLHGNAAGLPSWTSVVSADLNITTTSCTNQFISAISATATGTCSTVSASQLGGLGTNVGTALGTATGSVNGFPRVIATGTIALGTSAISSGTCGTAATATATNALTTDVIDVGFNSDPTGVTGYTPAAMLTLVIYPTANTVNVKQCNLTNNSITPGALTLNWWIRR